MFIFTTRLSSVLHTIKALYKQQSTVPYDKSYLIVSVELSFGQLDYVFLNVRVTNPIYSTRKSELSVKESFYSTTSIFDTETYEPLLRSGSVIG